MDELQPWHRWFGMAWIDFFHGMPVTVELEKDLSLKKQLLDVVILRKEAASLPCQLPDGLDDLAAHNLITFKSHHEALDGWALLELLGHYVNYRKQVSPSMNDLLPETDFRLYAISVRFPAGLARLVPLTLVKAGVYEVGHYTGTLRVIVVRQLPQEEYNAMMLYFSAHAEKLRYATEHYQPRSKETSSVLAKLLVGYVAEGVIMPGQLEEYVRVHSAEIARLLTPEQRVEGLAPEKRVEGLSLEDRLKGLALPPETIEALRKQLQEGDSSTNPD
jgi:hypothetical protein